MRLNKYAPTSGKRIQAAIAEANAARVRGEIPVFEVVTLYDSKKRPIKTVRTNRARNKVAAAS